MTEHVKVYGVKPRIQYTADGELITYEFPFAIFKSNDIEAYFGDTKQASNTYTVSGVGNSDGGSVTFNEAPASGTVITLIRNLSIERTSDFQEGSSLRAKVLNDELDYQIACQQQIADNLNRSMVLPPYATDNNLDLTLPLPSAGKAIVWNSDGTNLENSTVAVNALESTLKSYKEDAESAASTASTKADLASDKADVATTQAQTATTQAGIATTKATEAATTVASKANKNIDNLTETGKENLVNLMMPDWNRAIAMPFATENTATSAGWLFVNATQRQTCSFTLNSKNFYVIGHTSENYNKINTVMIPVSKNDTYNCATQSGGSSTFVPELVFLPCKGV